MIDSEISKLYENLSLVDEDGAVHEMAEDAQLDGVADVNHCLVGKVLSGKRVNTEAFRTLIEQLWSPFGAVNTELVGENIFMFYFNNQVDRDQIWQRGPWYFEKSLIALEKPTGLKYERLPEFCYACGKIGHGIKECLDLEARNEALVGKTMKFGSWMRATVPERTKIKNQSYMNGSSTDKERSLEGSREVEIENSYNKEPNSVTDQKKIFDSSVATQMKRMDESSSKTLAIISGSGPNSMGGPLTDGLVVGKVLSSNASSRVVEKAQTEQGLFISEPTGNMNKKVSAEITESTSTQPVSSDMVISPKKKSNRKWKRLTREGHSLQISRLVSSPIQRALALRKLGKKSMKCNSFSPLGPKLTGRIGKVKSPTKGARLGYPSFL
ncbi:hypothetical protein EZV62_028135 [Acer yangbiense]|uniref:CCHC-type domain-containing protein n=1 Tax=Acer yangbiense TaxID=1000413 RepID=A0A5C7GP54_9ROSI|nr:hypothetical protein EZV62_028135 [Acer yangbiense]